MKKKDIHNYLYLTFICLFLISMILDPINLFGSKTDWINQHTVFPDYFRKLFYETGNLIPSFAPNIGGGQNIFNFSYYGLLNPIILISYLFPMISMTDYLIAMNIILYTSTSSLLYKWLKGHTKDTNIAFFSTILTIFSSSFIFHFHRHFMFVNYMPFLILGLIGVDTYFDKKSKWLLTLSTFLMIMISYYYSIVGIIILVLYGIYRYIKMTNHVTIKSFFQVGIPFLYPIIIGIFMAGILLFPTLHVILTSRSSVGTTIKLKDLLLPKLNLNGLLYGTYTLGLTAISFIALLHCSIKKEAHTKFLAISCILILTIPLFVYLLNGTLYIRDKVLIPFLPIFALFLVNLFSDLKKRQIHFKFLFTSSIIISLLALIFHYDIWYFYLDIIITLLCIWAYLSKPKNSIIIIPLLVISMINLAIGNLTETFVSKEDYNKMFSSEIESQIETTLKKEKNLVRFQQLDYTLYTINYIYNTDYYNTTLYSSTYHNEYNNFFKNEFHNAIPNRNHLILGGTNNIMFQTLMGIKYVHYSKRPAIGYRKLKDTNIAKNNSVLPIGYATDSIMSEKEFDTLKYPETNEMLIGNAIVNTNKPANKFVSHIKEINSKYKKIGFDNPNIKIKEENGKYIIDVKEDTKVKLKLEESFKDEILFIDFKIENQNSCNLPDQKITINGVMNKLTCKEWQYQNENHIFHYALSKNKKWDTLDITFGIGHYEISNIHTSILDYNVIKEKVSQVDPWNVKKENAKGNVIKGDITVKKDGYFVTSIPYDDGFEIYLDGKNIEYEKVNKAFLGFPIKKGKHQIKLVYKAPLLKVGMTFSGIGFILFGILIYTDIQKRKTCLKS